MKYYFKTYIWENGQKKIDLTPKLVAPIFIHEKLDETLDVGEIIIDMVDNDEFGLGATAIAPKTKIRIEVFNEDPDTNPELVPIKTWDMVVESDEVEEYRGVG